jgi:hypothetical protein
VVYYETGCDKKIGYFYYTFFLANYVVVPETDFGIVSVDKL